MRSDVQVNCHNNTERKLQSHDYLQVCFTSPRHASQDKSTTMPKDGPKQKQNVYANTLWIYGKGKDVLGNWKDRQNGKSQQGQPVACARY